MPPSPSSSWTPYGTVKHQKMTTKTKVVKIANYLVVNSLPTTSWCFVVSFYIIKPGQCKIFSPDFKKSFSVTPHSLHLTPDSWLLTPDSWLLTPDSWASFTCHQTPVQLGPWSVSPTLVSQSPPPQVTHLLVRYDEHCNILNCNTLNTAIYFPEHCNTLNIAI